MRPHHAPDSFSRQRCVGISMKQPGGVTQHALARSNLSRTGAKVSSPSSAFGKSHTSTRVSPARKPAVRRPSPRRSRPPAAGHDETAEDEYEGRSDERVAATHGCPLLCLESALPKRLSNISSIPRWSNVDPIIPAAVVAPRHGSQLRAPTARAPRPPVIRLRASLTSYRSTRTSEKMGLAVIASAKNPPR